MRKINNITDEWLNPPIEQLKINNQFITGFIDRNYEYMIYALQEKYGIPPYPYIEKGNTSPCARKGMKRRQLEIHHIQENCYANLGTSLFLRNIYTNYKNGEYKTAKEIELFDLLDEAQQPDQLVYANIFEHLALHMVLTVNENGSINKVGELNLGMGGVIYLAYKILIALVYRENFGIDNLTTMNMNICNLYDADIEINSMILKQAKEMILAVASNKNNHKILIRHANIGLSSRNENTVESTKIMLKDFGIEVI